MVVKKYEITYVVDMKTYKVKVILDDAIEITDEKSKLHIHTSEVTEALSFIKRLQIDNELKHDLSKFIDEALVAEKHNRINLFLIELENSFDNADEKFEQKYLEFRNRFNNITEATQKDIESFEHFEDEVDQSK